ncbi:MAG TPA: hypothetical protein VFA45_00805, partial [Actinomycetes bacterium]|nr:hypothetical protein [Actinomycetes bacterium]
VEAQRPRCHPNRQHLPATPVLEAIDSYATRRRLSLHALLGPAGCRSLQRARQSGEVTLVTVEDFCDRLGLHPRELYGDAYDRAAFAYVARRPAPVRVRERSRSGGER